MSQERNRLIFDSADFWKSLETDIAGASSEILVQTMSFEADSAGRKLIELLAGKPNLRRVLLIDSYSKAVVNDTFLFRPGFSRRFLGAWKERQGLNSLLLSARRNGIEVRFTEPLGFLLRRYPNRNHKKVILIDDRISYLGGRNFTDHNLAWQDLMIRQEHPDLHKEIRRGFEGDVKGSMTSLSETVHLDSHTRIYHLDGNRSREIYTDLLNRVSRAKSLTIVSPYLSGPFLSAAVKVPELTLILPAQNNKWTAELALRWSLKRRTETLRVIRVKGPMVHAKFMILDDRSVLYGSSNFDLISYLFEKEIVVESNDPSVVSEFRRFLSSLIKTDALLTNPV